MLPTPRKEPMGNSKGVRILIGKVRLMTEARRLSTLGIGLTDAHLIAPVFINPSTLLWTRDKPLHKAAEARRH
jgi:hypothetical protein